MKRIVLALVLFFAPLLAHAQTITTTPSTANLAPLSAAMPAYDYAGTQKMPSHLVIFSCTLALGSCTVNLSGAATYTDATSYFCWSSDQSGTILDSTVIPQTGTSFKVYGTSLNTVRGGCIGW